MNLSISLILLVISSIGGMDEHASRYNSRICAIEFDGETKELSFKDRLSVGGDVDTDRYRYYKIMIPYKGEISKVKIRISGRDKTRRTIKKKDAIVVARADENMLASDILNCAWDLGIIRAGDLIEYDIKIKHAYGYAGDYICVMDDLPVDTAKIEIKFPSKKWRLKYSVDNSEPAYYDAKDDTVFYWFDIPAKNESAFKDAPEDCLPGLWFSFQAKDNGDDFSEWGKIYSWYKNLADSADIYGDFEDMIEIADSPEEILATIKKQCRYLAVEIGDGWYIPISAKTVWSNGYGDCKGLTNLFIGWLIASGYQAWPVLVLSDADRLGNAEFPTPFIFDHMIAAFESAQGDTVYQDLTAEYCPLGNIPVNLFGSMALPMFSNGSPMRLAYSETAPDTIVFRISGELHPDNVFRGGLETRLKGQKALIVEWANNVSKKGSFENYIQSFLEKQLSRVIYRNPQRDSSEENVVAFSADIYIKNFSYKKGDSLLVKPWIFDFLDYNRKIDSTRSWLTIRRCNILYKVEYRARIQNGIYNPSADTSFAFENENIEYSFVNGSHGDSLIADLTLYLPPMILDPDSYNRYVVYRRTLSQNLNNRIMFIVP